jgi:hypothetical protein
VSISLKLTKQCQCPPQGQQNDKNELKKLPIGQNYAYKLKKKNLKKRIALVFYSL